MNQAATKPTVTLNLTGLSCPHPLLGARKMLEDMQPGEVLLLTSDCPGTQADLFSWVKLTDNELIQTGKDENGAGTYSIRKGKRAPLAAQVSIDMRGVLCPGPIIEAKKLLGAMQAGETLKLVSSCSAANDDIRTWTENTGYTLLANWEVEPGVFEFYIRK
jgi:TusA-related sulfurtransferase